MKREAYVAGSGPNGLTAAIVLARAGVPTTLLEALPQIGGGLRSAELTLPGFVHDVCSAVHPMALSSPAFREFPLGEHGLEWIQPEIPLAHPLDGGGAVFLYRSIDETAAQFPAHDAARWRGAFAPLVKRWLELASDILFTPRTPSHPLLMARFGALAGWPANGEMRLLFNEDPPRALFGGCAAHSSLSMDHLASSSFGWVLAAAGHGVGWPIPRGGSQRFANALASYFESLGGKIVRDACVASLKEFGAEAIVLLDVTARQFLHIARDRLPESYARALEHFRYGPGVFKIDWALNAPIPWTNRSVARAGTVHVCGSFDEIVASEAAPWTGTTQERPFVLLAQPSLVDPSRAPAGMHTAWAYCHVPNNSSIDMTERIESQVERFAPGFGRTIIARHTFTAKQAVHHNPNLVGGDINGGMMDWKHLAVRPTPRLYGTPLKNVYLCSASTPPGGAVHGMCGYRAANLALKRAGVLPRS